MDDYYSEIVALSVRGSFTAYPCDNEALNSLASNYIFYFKSILKEIAKYR